MGKTATLANIGSIADSSLGFRNRIINGAMLIDQRNAGAAVAVTGNTGQMSVDRFLTTVFGSGTGRFTAQQSSTVPSGFINSLSATVTTADASPTSAYAYSLAQIIEGLNVTDLGWGAAGAATVTLSFWVRSSVTGTFPVVLMNGAVDRAYGATYTISSANTFEYKTITIAGDTSGTWLKTNGAGINIQFGLGGGSARTVAAGWQANAGATTQTNVTGCTQLIATSGATFYITGVQLEKGATATSFDYRPYGTELALCQRYYYKYQAQANTNAFGSGYVVSATAIYCYTPFKVALRTSPTALEQNGTAADYSAGVASGQVNCSSVVTFLSASLDSAWCTFTVASGLTAGQGCFGRSSNANAYLAWSAEL